MGVVSLNEMQIEDLNFSLPKPDEIAGVSLWIDAADESNTTMPGTNEIDYLNNKIDASSCMATL